MKNQKGSERPKLLIVVDFKYWSNMKFTIHVLT